jgi:Nucleosome binding factor SPN, SPT16 subunit
MKIFSTRVKKTAAVLCAVLLVVGLLQSPLASIISRADMTPEEGLPVSAIEETPSDVGLEGDEEETPPFSEAEEVPQDEPARNPVVEIAPEDTSSDVSEESSGDAETSELPEDGETEGSLVSKPELIQQDGGMQATMGLPIDTAEDLPIEPSATVFTLRLKDEYMGPSGALLSAPVDYRPATNPFVVNSIPRWNIKGDNGFESDVFCVEYGRPATEERPGQQGDKLDLLYSKDIYGTELIEKLYAAAYYGYYQPISVRPVSEQLYFYSTSQTYIWELLGTKFTVNNVGDYAAQKAVVEAQVNAFVRLPSINGATVKLKPGESKEIADTNGTLQNYVQANSIDPENNLIQIPLPQGITISKVGDGNTLRITADENAVNGTIQMERRLRVHGTFTYGNALYWDNKTASTTQAPAKQDFSTLEGQTVKNISLNVEIEDLPVEIETDAFIGSMGTQEIALSANTVISDRVTYKNLVAGKSYYLVATLQQRNAMGATTVGSEAREDFVASGANGYVDVTFNPVNTLNLWEDSHTGDKKIVVFEKLYDAATNELLATHESIGDARQTITFKTPEIGTEAFVGETIGIQNTGVSDSVKISDRVTYKNLIMGKEYYLKAVLVDQLGETIKEADLKYFTIGDSGTPNENGTVDVDFGNVNIVPSYLANNRKMIVYEYLYERGTDTLVAQHTDINDAKQTITVDKPEIGTEAFITGESIPIEYETKEMKASDSTEITDIVSYKNLKRDTAYALVATLRYQDDPDTVVGRTLEEFYIGADDSVNGHRYVKFLPIDTEELWDWNEDRDEEDNKTPRKLVVYEELHLGDENGPIIAVHDDPNDEKQIVTIEPPEEDPDEEEPVISTKAFFTSLGVNGPSETGPTNETTISDRVTYEGLIEGEFYAMVATLFNLTTGEELLDTRKVEFFEAGAEGKGYVDIEFENIRACDFVGKSLVVYEELWKAENIDETQEGMPPVEGREPMVVHKSKTDVHQTVAIETPTPETPVIETTAFITGTEDSESPVSVATISKDTKITDVVKYMNLEVGEQYKLVAQVMLKVGENDRRVIGEGEKEFTAEAPAEGEDWSFVKVQMNSINTLDLADNSELVIFEKLYKMPYTEGDEPIAEHEDINDGYQTITLKEPKIGTKAFITGTEDGEKIKNTSVSQNTLITDVVEYENLMIGKTYKLVAKIVNRDNPSIEYGEGGELEFTVPAPTPGQTGLVNGSVKVPMDAIDSSAFEAGAKVVVFERLYEVLQDGEELIASHEDENDVDQTITFAGPEIKTKAFITGTEDSTKLKSAAVSSSTAITDIVEYKNLITGKKYKLVAEVVNKDTEEVLSRGEKIFEAVQPADNGWSTTKVEMDPIDTLTFVDGTKLVVFEVLYKIDEDGDGEEVEKDGEGNEVVYDAHENLNDTEQTITLEKDPITIGTSAIAQQTGGKYAPAVGPVTIVDTVTYENLTPGVEYRLVAVLMDKATNSEILVGGAKITGTETFTPLTANGSVEVNILVSNASVLAGKTTVVFEKLFKDDEQIAVHEDINDGGQTVYFPEIGTTAVGANGLSTIKPGEDVVINDTVRYSNLIPGGKYTLVGTLMVKETDNTGIPLLINGSSVVVLKTFEANGTSEVVTFTIDAKELANKNVVVFEKLYLGDFETIEDIDDSKLVAVHEDINDPGQTVSFVPDTPTIYTSAKDSATGEQVILAKDGTVKVVDAVDYYNLIPNKEYILRGILMDKDTGNPFTIDGNTVTQEKIFTPTFADDTEILEFTFSAKGLEGKTLVVFEELFTKNSEGEEEKVTEHKDLNDVPQTVYFPRVGTRASKGSVSGGNVTIIDEVSYWNLMADKDYVVRGVLMDKATGQPLMAGGSQVTAEAQFRASSANGKVNLTFTFDGSAITGKTVVVFEKLYLVSTDEGGNSLEIEVANHEDINDQAQTVVFGDIDIGTEATDDQTKEQVSMADGDVTIIDKVTYTGLVIGKEYTVKGELMDKATGQPLMIGGSKVTAEETFIAETENGFVNLTFNFDGSALKGKTLVAFERLYDEGVEVATHTNINDPKQTIYFPEVGTMAEDSETQIHIGNADASVTIIDSVSYSNLIPGKKYVIEGVLMDKGTRQPLRKADGSEIKARSVEFTPAEGDPGTIGSTEEGRIEVRFTFDGNNLEGGGTLAGKSVVVFEKLYINSVEENNEVANHEDINDPNQTVIYPAMGTSATRKGSTEQFVDELRSVTITDVISYSNLDPSKIYTVKGVLMNAATNAPLVINGNQITAEKKFQPEGTGGTVSLDFTFDAKGLGGASLVVFEKLYLGDYEGTTPENKNLVASHEDIRDRKQTVNVIDGENPSIGTSARDGKTGEYFGKAEENARIIDTVTYRNLLVGDQYTVKGWLMNKETGEPLTKNGDPIVKTATFTATAVNGTIDLEFEFDASDLKGNSVVVYEELYEGGSATGTPIAVHKDINDPGQTVDYPVITTEAKDDGTQKHIGLADEEVVIVDRVTYTNLRPGKTYTVRGVLMVKNADGTGSPLMVDGNPVEETVTFTPTQKDHYIDITFRFNGKSLLGKTIVVFEGISLDGKDVAVHEDIDDEPQTVYYPDIGTTASDSGEIVEIGEMSNARTITDIVRYKNLIPGEEYTIKGVLMDKETGSELIVNDEPVRAEKQFTPENPDGEIDIDFTFDGSDIYGKTIVVFEKLYTSDDKEIVVHEDINDEAQTVDYPLRDPEIKTSARDEANGTHVGIPAKTVTIIDTITYRHLIVGKEYTVKGVLMDKGTNTPLLANNEMVISERTFTAETEDGTIDLEFTFDGTSLSGKVVVVFEKLYLDDVEVATHEDIEDTDQSVYYAPKIPEISTSAKDNDTGTNKGNPGGIVTIVDTVFYTNLIAGKEYTVSGILMNKATGEPLLVNGREVRAEKDFVPDSENGSVDLTFEFDGSVLGGTTVVVFEKLYMDGVEIAVHEDIEDEAQTVDYPDEPSISTSAYDKASGTKTAAANASVTIIDTVTCRNLIVGKEYTVSGILMDKGTGEPLLVNGNEIRAEKTFVATAANGKINLPFTFNASALGGTTVVVFEKLYMDGREVAAHEDINDEAQTVRIVNVVTPKTGDEAPIHLYIIGLALSAAVVGFLFVSKRRKRKTTVHK